MPAKKKAGGAAADQQAKRTKTKSASQDESASPQRASDTPPGMSEDFHVIGNAQGFEVRARVRRSSSRNVLLLLSKK